MKTLLKISSILSLVTFLGIFQGCNKDDEDPPVLSLSSPNLVEGIYTTDESGVVEINVSVTSPQGFKTLIISFEGIDLDAEEIEASEQGQMSFNLDFELSEIVYGSSGSFSITFQAIDNNDQSVTEIVTVQPGLPTLVLLEDNPDIDNGTLKAEVGRFFNVRYRYTFPGGFGQFKVILTVSGSTSETLVTELPPTQGLAVSDALIFSFTQDYLGDDISYFLEVTDAQGIKAELQIPVQLSQPPVVIYEMVVLELPTGDKTSKSFFSTNIGETYSVNDVSNAEGNVAKEVDFGFFYDDTGGASLTGPGNFPSSVYNLGPNGENWPTLNIANFRSTSLSESEFDALDATSQATIDDAFDNASGENQLVIDGLQVGDVISFKTDLKNGINPKGILKVTNVVGPGGTDPRIELVVKINL